MLTDLWFLSQAYPLETVFNLSGSALSGMGRNPGDLGNLCDFGPDLYQENPELHEITGLPFSRE